MKKCLICFGLVIICFIGNAQVDIKKEIIAFSDTTELIIRNGRKLIVEKTVSGDHEGAIQTLNYLKNNIDERYVILYPYEEILISLANRSFELFLYNVRNFNSLLQNKTKSIQMDEISDEIHIYLSKEMDFITEELDNSDLAVTDNTLIKLYIRYYLNDNKAVLNKDIKAYEKKYPQTEYSDFLNKMKSSTTTGRMNFCIGFGTEFLNGNISKNFNNHFQMMNFEFDGFINQFYTSLFMEGSVGKLTSTTDIPVRKKDLIHKEGESVSSLKYGLKMGRTIFSNHTFNLYPYISIGGYEMNSQSPEFEPRDTYNPKNNLSASFFTGIGASCDIMIKTWGAKKVYDPSGYLFIRPSMGYDFFLTNKEISKGSDFYLSFSLGIGFGGNN